MIVTCPSCAARYRLKDSKVTARGARITCPSCAHVFVVYPDQAEAAQEAAAGGASAVVQRPVAPVPPPPAPARPEPARRRSAEALDFRKVGINAWKVKVRIGLTYDFADVRTLRKFITDGRVTGEDKISHDGRTWVTIGDIPDLDAFFIEVYERAEAEQEAARGGGGQPGFEDDDSPTMIVGMSTLSTDLAADALRQATSSSDDLSSDLPGPHTPTGEGAFVDPFAALKSKQRERIQARRTATAPLPPKPEPASGSRATPVVVVLLIAGLALGWWFTRTPEAPPAPPPAPTSPAEPEVAEPGPAQPGAADDLRRIVEQTLQEDEGGPDPSEEEPVLIPVGPRDGATNPGGNRPPSGAVTPPAGAAVDHAANCRQFARNRDWSQATLACAEALKSQPSDAELLTHHGVALYETGNREAAASKLRGAADRGSATARKILGHIARDNGDVAGAIGHYNAYLATNPSDRAAIEAEISRLTGG